jgi:hypothetical protein
VLIKVASARTGVPVRTGVIVGTLIDVGNIVCVGMALGNSSVDEVNVQPPINIVITNLRTNCVKAFFFIDASRFRY